MGQQKYIQKLLAKPMDRKQFLAHLGAAVLAVLGIGGLLRTLINFGSHSAHHAVNGYGSSPYGGGTKG